MSKKPPGLTPVGVRVKGYTVEGACLAVRLRKTTHGGYAWAIWPLMYNTALSAIVRWEPFEDKDGAA